MAQWQNICLVCVKLWVCSSVALTKRGVSNRGLWITEDYALEENPGNPNPSLLLPSHGISSSALTCSSPWLSSILSRNQNALGPSNHACKTRSHNKPSFFFLISISGICYRGEKLTRMQHLSIFVSLASLPCTMTAYGGAPPEKRAVLATSVPAFPKPTQGPPPK